MTLQSEAGGTAAEPSRPVGAAWLPVGHALLRRRWRWLAVAMVALLSVVLALSAASSGGGTAGAGLGVAGGGLSTFKHALSARLAAEHLNYRWIVCVPTGRSFASTRVVRCNVDFGEPHIVAYCSVFRAGRLLTSADDASIPCGHDDAGYAATIMQYR